MIAEIDRKLSTLTCGIDSAEANSSPEVRKNRFGRVGKGRGASSSSSSCMGTSGIKRDRDEDAGDERFQRGQMGHAGIASGSASAADAAAEATTIAKTSDVLHALPASHTSPTSRMSPSLEGSQTFRVAPVVVHHAVGAGCEYADTKFETPTLEKCSMRPTVNNATEEVGCALYVEQLVDANLNRTQAVEISSSTRVAPNLSNLPRVAPDLSLPATWAAPNGSQDPWSVSDPWRNEKSGAAVKISGPKFSFVELIEDDAEQTVISTALSITGESLTDQIRKDNEAIEMA